MNANGIIQTTIYWIVLLSLAWPLGRYMSLVYSGDTPRGVRWLGSLEKLVYRAARIHPDEEMSWKRYAAAMLLFNAMGFLVVYALQRFQTFLPLNPAGLGAVAPDSSFNTAMSFATNTNWQGYGGESTMSYLTQMAGLAVQNFLSAATGMAILLPLIRGFTRKESKSVGSFWVDLNRSIVYILLPLSLLFALFLVSQGVVQSFSAYRTASLVEATDYETTGVGAQGQPLKDERGNAVIREPAQNRQLIPLGPAASQVAIKQLGTNGGGFFNANSAHPLENPTPLSNFFEMISILLIASALCFTFGEMVGDARQGRALLVAMVVLLLPFLVLGVHMEQSGNPFLNRTGITQAASDRQAGGNMEGKEVRFGPINSAIWAAATTAASNGSVNSMHDSFTPLGGLVPMVMMGMSEVVFGGVGSGLYGMIVYAIVAVFVAGLMVGRTPEYLGKKIESYEMKMAAIVILVPCALSLLGAAAGVATKAGLAGILNPGPHGFSEVLYGFLSAGNNNGSAFAGLSANTPFYNTVMGIAMFLSRYWCALPVLAIAGSLAEKKQVPVGAGTLPTHTPLFVGFLVGTVLLVGALTYLPAFALGPVVEHLMRGG